MQNFIIMLLICSVTMSALAMFYMAFTPFLAKRYTSKSRYYAWLIIVVGLIIPFRPQFDTPFVKIIPTDAAMPIIQLGNETQLASQNAGTLLHAESLKNSLPWWQITAAVWLIGVIAFIICHLIKHYRFIKMTTRWSEIISDEETLRLFRSIKTELGISKELSLYRCVSIGTPMLAGFMHPKILLPDIGFSKETLCFILKHELVHYKRKDLWYKCLVLFAASIHWFNPLMRLIAGEIDIQCEISCDFEVVNRTDADTRQHYSEAIIGVVKYQSNMKTALSTNFYGGKKGMKKRIFSIMDTRNKKAGIAIFSSVLILTLGTGFAFAANAQTNSQPEYIKEDIVVSPESSYAYKFLPAPDIYAAYSSYDIAISDNGEELLYQGQKIKLFVDEYSDIEAFYYDDAGTVNLSVARSSSGKITGINLISSESAQKYRSAFFADDTKNQAGTSKASDNKNSTADISESKYEQYSPYGITYIAEKSSLYLNGKKIRLLVDESDGFFDTFWFDEAGAVDLSVVRSSSGQIDKIETISKEKAQNYLAETNKIQQEALSGLDEKVEKRINELYPASS